jgi:uncharacterized protein (DUF1501 family)
MSVRDLSAWPGRRAFLAGGALALLGTAIPVPVLLRPAQAGRRGPVLLAVFLRGAVDGLSAVVPHGDPGYAPGRPSIAIAPPRAGGDGAVDLDGFFSLHPALRPLLPAWTAGRLAVVHACGSPNPTRSHFDAQDDMETGTPGVRSTADGWLGRALAARTAEPASPLRGVALGPRLPRSLRGSGGVLAVPALRDFELRPGAVGGGPALRAALEGLYETGTDDAVSAAGRRSLEAMRMLRASGAGLRPPAPGAVYPPGRFGEQLRQLAQLVKADLGLEVGFAESGGWDTHVGQGNERGPLAGRLGELAEGLAALERDLGDRLADVVVLVMSEFGRTVRENGAGGTDHGRGTAMLLLGGPVRGGRVYGRWPGLAPEQLFEGRDLEVTTDFRQLFAEVAERHLGVAPGAALFPGFRPPSAPLGVLG